VHFEQTALACEVRHAPGMKRHRVPRGEAPLTLLGNGNFWNSTSLAKIWVTFVMMALLRIVLACR